MIFYDSLSGIFFECDYNKLTSCAEKHFDNKNGYFYTTIRKYYDWISKCTTTPIFANFAKILKHCHYILFDHNDVIKFDFSSIIYNNDKTSCININVYYQ